MLVLGIESSCDETAAAVVKDGRKILSSIVASQHDIHGRYGGVVPELASRKHIVSIIEVVQLALSKADVSIDQIDGIAVTRGPGLVGSLLVGFSFAKALSFSRKIPFVGVHHIEAHMAAALLGPTRPNFPLVGLVVSGGHTDLYKLPDPGSFQLLAKTLDDAAGEAFDKVAKLLGLPYPGGPSIDTVSQEGNPNAIRFPRPAKHTHDFSFSGLKTAVAIWIQEHGVPTGKALADLAASFQEAVGDVLVDKLFETADREGVEDVAVCGGVAKNRRLRTRMMEETKKRQMNLWLADLELCTDNAAMVAAAGYARLCKGDFDDFSLNAAATLPLNNALSTTIHP